MDKNAELLNFIYQNSQMGKDTLYQLIGISKEKQFTDQLQSQFDEYTLINTAAKDLLNKNGYDEKDISKFAKVRSYLIINMQTMTDKTPSHISEMLIIGSNMGVIDAIKNIRKYECAEQDIVSLMKRLLKFEENNIKVLKEYL